MIEIIKEIDANLMPRNRVSSKKKEEIVEMATS
jgi:hypothetical protein